MGPETCAAIGGQYPDIDTIYSAGEDAHGLMYACWISERSPGLLSLACAARFDGTGDLRRNTVSAGAHLSPAHCVRDVCA